MSIKNRSISSGIRRNQDEEEASRMTDEERGRIAEAEAARASGELRAGGVTTLLPCPFCGSRAKYDVGAGPFEGGEFVGCTNPGCAASTNIMFPEKDGVKSLLAEKWNRRSLPTTEAR